MKYHSHKPNRVLWIVAGICLLAALMFARRAFSLYLMGTSLMYPSIQRGDLAILKKNPSRSDLHIGDIVSFHADVEGKRGRYLRRIVGFPGDPLRQEEDMVRINSFLLSPVCFSRDIGAHLISHDRVQTNAVIPPGRYCIASDYAVNHKAQIVNVPRSAEEFDGKVVLVLPSPFRRSIVP